MRVFLTGADGYIGHHVFGVLVRRGHDVVGLDTGFYRDGWLYGDRSAAPQCLPLDVRAVEVEDLRGFDAVVHLAELSNDPLGQMNPEITYELNHRGSVQLARRCRAAGVRRFVYSSSCSVYGLGDANEEVKTETSAVNPQTAYAECKVRVERDVAALASDDFSPTFLRNATAFGPSPRMRFDIVLNNLAGLAWTSGEIRMTSDGTPWRPLVHVLDIAEAIACTLEAPPEAVHNQVLNVGDNGANYRVRDIAEIVAEAFPGCRLTFGHSDGDRRSYRVCFDKIHSQLPGFCCRYDAQVGARQLRQVFEDIGMTREVFEFRAFTRLKQINHLVSTGQLDQRLRWRAGQPRS